MTKLLQDAGEALYGPQWQSALAADLMVSGRTIRGWLSGKSDVPPGVYMDLWRLCEERAAALDDVISRLKTSS